MHLVIIFRVVVTMPSINKVVLFKSAGQGLSPINTTANNTLAGAGTATFVDNSCYLVAEVKTAGALPVTGLVNAKVWLETTQPTQYVKRHYEITPSVNTTTATAKVTLYFTQQEFNDFNAVNTIDLPTAANDNVGIANLLIEKRNGTSSNGTGLPNTYAGAITTINPADVDVVWNAEDSRWEISFDVTGFSGFFVKTTLGVLPIQWLHIQGKLLPNKFVEINWKVAENNIAQYEVEQQTAANIFEKIGLVPSKGDGENEYSFVDSKILVGIGLYRIKQTGLDGKISYSSIVKLSAANDKQIQVYPNPVEDILTATLNQTNIKNATAQLLTIDGKMITTQKVSSQVFTINTSNLKTGVYVLKIINDTEVYTQRVMKK
jgi:Secretion system C-terminal sorting domain